MRNVDKYIKVLNFMAGFKKPYTILIDEEKEHIVCAAWREFSDWEELIKKFPFLGYYDAIP